MAEIKLTKQNFASEVLASEKPVLVDFWATWCGPCQMIAPIIEEIAGQYENVIRVGKVNVDEERELAVEYGIDSIPTLLIIKDGKVFSSAKGYRPKEDVVQMIEKAL